MHYYLSIVKNYLYTQKMPSSRQKEDSKKEHGQKEHNQKEEKKPKSETYDYKVSFWHY